MTSPFTHRIYLGWITDLASQPDPQAAWPSMRRDAQLLEDYRTHLDAVQELGFTGICVWGLVSARDWPLDLVSALTSEKLDFAASLRELTSQRGLQLLAGVGVFSWGFDRIISAYPHLGPTSPRAMCPHQAESWDWMYRVIDLLFDHLDIDGIQMQSADQGRCECIDCLRWTPLEHHAILNTKVAQYVRQRWPGKTMGVNSWGMKFTPAELTQALPLWREMGEVVDYFTGIDDTSTRGEVRPMLIEALPCAVGTLGGSQVEPPQHFERDRWFLPLSRRTSEHIRGLAAEGGRSCEAFFQTTANPGDELSLWVRGYALQDPYADWHEHLEKAVVRLYEPRGTSATRAVCDLFSQAEEAYFGHARNVLCRTFPLEILDSSEASRPIYLDLLDEEDLADYGLALTHLRSLASQLESRVKREAKMQLVGRCLGNALSDVRAHRTPV